MSGAANQPSPSKRFRFNNFRGSMWPLQPDDIVIPRRFSRMLNVEESEMWEPLVGDRLPHPNDDPEDFVIERPGPPGDPYGPPAETYGRAEQMKAALAKELRIHVSPVVKMDHVIHSMVDEIEENMLVRCLIGNFVTPGEFWVMIMQFYNALEAMMECMKDVYNKLDGSKFLERFVPTHEQLKVGMLVVAKLRDTDWHRCCVLDIQSSDTTGLSYLVRAIDFGDAQVVERSNIRFLFSQFANMKAQAIPCKARISSIYHASIPGRDDLPMLMEMDQGQGWTSHEKTLFRETIFDRPLSIRFLNRSQVDPDLWFMNVHPWCVFVHMPIKGPNGLIEIPHVERYVFAKSRNVARDDREVGQDLFPNSHPETHHFDTDKGLDRESSFYNPDDPVFVWHT